MTHGGLENIQNMNFKMDNLWAPFLSFEKKNCKKLVSVVYFEQDSHSDEKIQFML
jgi:hypothetical protein